MMLHPEAPSWKDELSEAARRLLPRARLMPAWTPRGDTTSRDKLDATNTLQVEQGEPERLRRFSELAAAPAVGVVNAGNLVRLFVHAPGATVANTEVRWDQANKELLVGVWCGSRPRVPVPVRLPLPELAWFRSFHLPECHGDGARAQVTRRGTVMIEMPGCASTLAASQPTAPSPPNLKRRGPRVLGEAAHRFGADETARLGREEHD